MANLEQTDERAVPSTKEGLAAYLTKLLETWQRERKSSIENVWAKCESNFNGEYDGPPLNDKEDAWRSRAVYPLTEQKVTAAEALMNDAMFMSGQLPYHLESTPIEDSPVNEELQAQGFNLDENMARHRELIGDELAESKAIDHAKAAVHQCVKLGTGCMQSPYVHTVKRNAWSLDPATGAMEKETYEDITPGLRYIDVYNAFPDPEGGGDAQEGAGIFIREWMDRSALRGLLAEKETTDAATSAKYDLKAIKLLLEGEGLANYGEVGASQSPDRNNINEPLSKFEVYEFAGRIQNRILKAHLKDIEGEDEDYSEILATISEEQLLRVVQNPYPGQGRPYHIIPYNKVSGSPWGRGVAQKVFDPQESTSALLRKYLDNKILSGDVMFKLDRSALMKGTNTKIYPGKIWEFNVGTDMDKAFQPITVPDTTRGTFEAIGSLLELADNVSGVPRILEGQPGVRNATAFADNQRIQAASKQMGAVLKNFDQYGWVPIIEALYDFNMEFSDDDTIKGDFKPMATGFSSFENRNVKLMNLERKLELGGTYPEVGDRMNYQKILEAMAEAEHMRPEDFYYTDEEYQQIQQQRAEQAAKANAEALDSEIRLMYEKSNAEAETRLKAIEAKGEVDMALQDEKLEADMSKKLIEAENRDADRQGQIIMTDMHTREKSDGKSDG